VNVEALREAVRMKEIDTVVVAMTDMQGRLQGKRFHAPFFLDEVVAHNTEACAYLLAVDTEMNTVDGYQLASWETGYGDFVLVHDRATLRAVPWQPGTALVLADVAEVAGGPVAVSPRQVLRAQLGAVRSRAHLMLSEFAEAVAVAGQTCDAADRIAGVAPAVAEAVRARAYWVLGVTARLRGQPDEAAGWLRRAVTAARAAGLREVAGRALFNLGAIAHELGDGAQAERFYTDALAQARPIGDGYGTARVLHALGMLRHQADAVDEAAALYEEAHALKLRMGDALGAATTEHSLALLRLSQGRTEAARAMLAGIVDATETLGERRAQAHYLDSLAMVDLVEGDPKGAQRRLAEAARIAAGIDTPSLTASVAVHRALALLAAGDLAAAAREASACADQVANSGARAHASVAIEHAALTACLALATGIMALLARST